MKCQYELIRIIFNEFINLIFKKMRKFYFIVFVLATIIVVNLNYASKDVNTSGITLKELIQTAFADNESPCSPQGECRHGYFCSNGICKPLVSLQTKYCSIVDWCLCPQGYTQLVCQGVETVCSPDQYGHMDCGYSIECHGCDPCSANCPDY